MKGKARWEQPKRFRCDGCGATAAGALTWNALGTLPDAETLPAGWLLRRASALGPLAYVCSIACATKVEVL